MANLRVPQAAEYLGVSKSLLDKLRCYGSGPAYFKIGATIIYSTDDLNDWIASRRVVPANDNRPAAARAAA